MRKEVPIWQKGTLSIEEAAAYSGIGMHKLREIAKSPECNFALYVGQRLMIKRRKFDMYLEESETI